MLPQLQSIGMPINAIDLEGSTALHCAARGGHKQVIEVLLNGDANLEAVDLRGRTALHIAVEHGRDDIVFLLIRQGANVRAKVQIRSER